mgnify:CR=1 FL=1
MRPELKTVVLVIVTMSVMGCVFTMSSVSDATEVNTPDDAVVSVYDGTTTKYYDTFSDVYTATSDLQQVTVTLLQSTIMNSAWTISSGNVILDLNGKTLTLTTAVTYFITVNAGANLTIQDTSSEHDGMVTANVSTFSGSVFVLVHGTLNFTSGTIEIPDGYGTIFNVYGTCNISGGTLTNGGSTASYVIFYRSDSSGEITGGTLGAPNTSSRVQANGTIGIGTQDASTGPTVYNTMVGSAGTVKFYSGLMQVSGGGFTSDDIMEGTFLNDVSQYLPAGFECISNGVGGYIVTELNEDNAKASLTHNGAVTYYSSVNGAANDMADGDTLTLLDDYVGGTIEVNSLNGTIDLGGYSFMNNNGGVGIHVYPDTKDGGGTFLITSDSPTTITAGIPVEAGVTLSTNGLTLSFENVTLVSSNDGYSVDLNTNTRIVYDETTRNYKFNGGFLATVDEDGQDIQYIYGTAVSALEASKDDKAIMLNNYSGTINIGVGENFVLDLGGNTVTYEPGTITDSLQAAIEISSSDVGVIIKNGNIKTTVVGIAPGTAFDTGVSSGHSENVSLTLQNVNIESSGDFGIYSNGNCVNVNVEIVGGSVKNTGTVGTGIYFPADGSLTIDNVIVEGPTGIEMRNGFLTVTGDDTVITATATEYDVSETPVNGGSTVTGAAIAISPYSGLDSIGVSISGKGEFTGNVAFAQVKSDESYVMPQSFDFSIMGGTFTSTGNTYSAVIAENANGFIMGGTYSDKPDSNYFTNGYQSSDIMDENGNYTVVTTEDPVVVNESTGQEYATLQDALDAAQDGETIRLLKDIVLGGDGNNPGAIIKSGVTIDGSNPDGGVFMISSSTALKVLATVNEASFGDVLTLKNLKVENTSGITQARCLDTRGLSSGLALEGVILTVPEGSETQPLTIGGECSSVLKIEITNTVIQSSAKGYAIIIFNPVDMTITDSELRGWAVIYLKDKNASAGSSGSNVFVSDSTIVSTNSQPYDSSGNEDFGAIVVNDRGVTVELYNVDVTIKTTDGNEQKLFSSDIKTQASTTGNNTFRIGGEETEVTFIGSNTKFAFDSHNTSTFEVTGGSYSKDVSDYLAPGLMVESDGSGMFRVVEAPETGLEVTYDPISPTDDQDVTVTATVTGVPEGTMITYIWNDEETTTTTDTTKTFPVTAGDSTEQTLSVSFTAYGKDKTLTWSHTFFVNRTVTVTFPDALGIADQQFSVRDGETFDVPFSEIEVPDGFLVTGYDYEGQPVTSDLTVTVECALESPTVSYTIDYHDGYTLVSVTYGHVLGDSVMFAVAMFDSDDPGFGPDGNTFTIRESGTYTLQVSCALIADKDIWGIYSVDIPIEVGSDSGIVIPPTDDDDYIPPIYVPSGSSSSDDDTVKIVACAAAAVVAAIMAAFLILGHRRE